MALGGMFIFVQTLGIINCSGVVPFVSKERNVLYRERFAGMYSSLAYSLAQVTETCLQLYNQCGSVSQQTFCFCNVLGGN